MSTSPRIIGHEHLAARAGIAGNAIERRAGRAPLADAAAESGQADGESGADTQSHLPARARAIPIGGREGGRCEDGEQQNGERRPENAFPNHFLFPPFNPLSERVSARRGSVFFLEREADVDHGQQRKDEGLQK